MFRLTKLKPPQGWKVVAWELAIVTLGVLLALAAHTARRTRTRGSKIVITFGHRTRCGRLWQRGGRGGGEGRRGAAGR